MECFEDFVLEKVWVGSKVIGLYLFNVEVLEEYNNQKVQIFSEVFVDINLEQ